MDNLYLRDWLQSWRRKIEADDFSNPAIVRTHLIEVQRLLMELAAPATQRDARECLARYYAEREVADDEIPGPPPCAGGGCGED